MKRKFLFLIFAFAASFSVFSQKSDSDAASKESKNQTNLEKKQLSAEKKFRQKAVMDENLNLLYVKVSGYDLKGKSLRAALKNGSFNIFAKSDSGKETALLSSVNSSPVKFFLKYDGTVYNLNENSDVKKQIRQTQNGAQVVYSLENFFQISVDLSLVSTISGDDEDALLLKIYSTNLSGKTRSFSLKAIFDTVLGENLPYHFSSADGRQISLETMLYSGELKNVRYLLSSDRKNSLQLMLYGKEISPIKNVLIANPEILESLEWNGNAKTERGFNSINLYNNSAVMIFWRENFIGANSTVSDDFYIFTATDGRECRGEYFISDGENSKNLDKRDFDSKKDFAENSVPKKSVPENSDKKTEAQKNVNQTAKPAKSEKRTDVDFIVAPLDDYKFDTEYIQNLIDKIDAMQSDSENVDREEIERLNAELDAIFKVLRRQQ